MVESAGIARPPQQTRQIHFGISCLEATLQSRLHLALGVGFAHTLAEKI
jgi:hypothetical protein